MATGTQLDGKRVTQLSRPVSIRPADRRLANFADDASLKAYLDMGMMNVSSSGLVPGGFSAPPPSAPYSTTNLQESGVDEADVVKSDGRYIYSFTTSAGGQVESKVRVADVGPNASSLAVVGTVSLLGVPAERGPLTGGLYLSDQTLVAITSTVPVSAVAGFLPPAWAMSAIWQKGRTFVEVMSRAVPASPATLWRAEIDGHLVSSRRRRQSAVSRDAVRAEHRRILRRRQLRAHGAGEPAAARGHTALRDASRGARERRRRLAARRARIGLHAAARRPSSRGGSHRRHRD
jgi:hypothetical protein